MTFPGGGGGAAFTGGNAGASAHPFAGVPPEMRPGVERLLETEPEHPEPEVVFEHGTPDPDGAGLSLRRLVRPYGALALLAGVLVIVEAVTLQAGPLLTQIGIDDGITAKDFGVLVVVAGMYLVNLVVTGLTQAARVKVTGRIAAWVMNDLRVRVFTQLQRLSLSFYTGEKAGVIMTRMTADIENLQALLQEGLVQFAIQGLTMVIVSVVLFTYDVELALITIVLVVPVMTAMSLWFRRASAKGYLRVRDATADVIADLSESLQGVRVVTAHNRQRRNAEHHRQVTGGYFDASLQTGRINSIYTPGTQVVGVAGQIVLLAIGAGMVTDGTLTIGELVAFLLYLGSFFQPIQQLVQQYNTYQQGQSSVVKLRQLLSTRPEVAEAPGAVDLPRVEGEITFEDVSFGYLPDRPVISDVSLEIRAGETVAFVGPTGAGKSTLAKLVTRFYDPSAGRILIDGRDLRDVRIESLRGQLGVVPQEPFLFAGPLRDNIRFATSDASDDRVWEAVRAVGLDEVVERLPDGLDTVVQERGQSLSSGERQLVALARAFLAQPRVLVLDEATSNLDLRSEARIESALDVLLEGRTAILIAHRLSTAMKADRVVVVDEGRIVETGSHDRLVAAGGAYARMYATWTSQAAEAG
ncbi:ABC transporter ATP-binding protein [Actinomadura sp. NEAU-AAG7]|uniref:ABC transporter ATP-binding protein n=1 Tax=Actinomadura sp. NEAU-AAG7 TaxID=2839640 RepID=UPI001BE4B15B|nr:ABC transporter ATP-binding protein [Actinomadura sp. NEAU-AAG7]MBT2206890.1 ABC transporter ATP-binding protein/permease [Actinomadura sp. NEAU-AAG7]